MYDRNFNDIIPVRKKFQINQIKIANIAWVFVYPLYSDNSVIYKTDGAKTKYNKPSFVWLCCEMLLQCIFADKVSSNDTNTISKML